MQILLVLNKQFIHVMGAPHEWSGTAASATDARGRS